MPQCRVNLNAQYIGAYRILKIDTTDFAVQVIDSVILCPKKYIFFDICVYQQTILSENINNINNLYIEIMWLKCEEITVTL